MTAWKTWQRPRSGILRAPAIAPRSARTGRFSAEKSTSPLTAEPTHAVAGGAFARRHSCRRTLLLAECSHPRQSGRHQRAAARSFSRLWRAAESVCHGAAHGSHRADGRAFAGRDPPPEFSAARTDHDHRTNRARTDRSWETCSTAHWSFRTITRRNERFASENQVGDHKKRDGHCRVSARRGIHRIGRALSELRGRGGRMRRWQRSRAGFEHGIWPGNENRPLPDRRRSSRSAL